MLERIAEVVREKRVEGIAELRDESDRDGVRVVIELKRDADPDVVLNQLYRFTPLQTTLRHQHAGAGRRPAGDDDPEGDARGLHRASASEVITRRTEFELGQGARARPHLGRPRRRRRQYRRGDRADPRARPIRRTARERADGPGTGRPADVAPLIG